MTEIRIPLPRLSGLGVSNVVGLGGLVAVVVAVGLLAGWPWALLLGGVLAVSLSALVQSQSAVRPVAPAGASSVRPLRATEAKAG